jgi:hypothetical protein
VGAPKETNKRKTPESSESISYSHRLGALRSLLGTEVNDEEISILSQLLKQPNLCRRIEEHEIQEPISLSPIQNSLNSESVECGSRQSLHPLDTNLLDTGDLTSELHELDQTSSESFQRPGIHRQFSIPPGVIEDVRARQIYRKRNFLTGRSERR